MPIIAGYAYAENLAIVSCTATIGTPVVAATLDPPAATDYFVLWSGLSWTSATAIYAAAPRCKNIISGATFGSSLIIMADLGDRNSIFGFAKETIASTASQIYRVEFGATRAAMDNVAIIVMRAATSDYFATGTNASVTSTGFVNLATLSFTPSATGAYAVFVYGEINSSATVVASVGRARQALVVNGASHFIATLGNIENSNFDPYGNAAPFDFTTSEQAISFIASRTTGTDILDNGNTIIRNPSIMVWRLDTLPTYSYGQATGRTTVACSTATTDKLTVSLTTTATDYLVIGTGFLDGGNITLSGNVKLDEDNTDLTEVINEPSVATVENNFFLGFFKRSLTSATHNYKMQFRSESTNTTGLSESSLFVIKLSGFVQYLVTAAAVAVGTPLTVRRGGLVKAASTTPIALMVRQGRLIERAEAGGIAAVSVSRLAMLALAAVASGTARVVRQGQLILKAASSGVAALSLTKVYQYALAAVATVTALVVRRGQLTLSATATVTARVVRAMTMTAQAAVATVTALVVRQGQLVLAASSSVTALVSLVKTLTFNAIAVGVVTVTRATSMTLAAVSTGVALLVRSVSMTLAAIATGFADLWAKPVLRKFTGSAGLGIFMKSKTRWAKRKRNWKPRG